MYKYCYLVVILVISGRAPTYGQAITVDPAREVTINGSAAEHRFDVHIDSLFTQTFTDQSTLDETNGGFQINEDQHAGQTITCGLSGSLVGIECLLRSMGPDPAKVNIFIYEDSYAGPLVASANRVIPNLTLEPVMIDLQPVLVEAGDVLFVEIVYDADAYTEWADNSNGPYAAGDGFTFDINGWKLLSASDFAATTFVAVDTAERIPVFRVEDDQGGRVAIRNYALPLHDGASGLGLQTYGVGSVGWGVVQAADQDWDETSSEVYTTSKKVGIGLSSPLSLLHIQSPTWTSMTIEAAANAPTLQLTALASTTFNHWNMTMNRASFDDLQWSWYGSIRANLTNTANFSIGLASPVFPFHLAVGGNAQFDGSMVVNEALNLNSAQPSGTGLRVNGADALSYSGSTFTWGAGGLWNYFADNVGTGSVTNPGQALDVGGNVRANTMSGAGSRPVLALPNGNLDDIVTGLPGNEGVYILDFSGITGMDDHEAVDIVPFSHAYHQSTFTSFDLEWLCGVVHLPHQSTVTKIKVFYYDNNPAMFANIEFFFITMPNVISSPDEAWGYWTSEFIGETFGSSPNYQTMTKDNLSISIDNAANTYFILGALDWLSSTEEGGIRKVEIYYE